MKDDGDVNVDYYVDYHDKDSDNKENDDHAEIPQYHSLISDGKDESLGQFVQKS